ncbi:MAG: alpha/beta hydrolase family protein [Phycisphaerales bacterium JB065]
MTSTPPPGSPSIPPVPSSITLPSGLRQSAVTTRLAVETTPYDDGGVPALLTHPEDGWDAEGASPTPAPVCLWFHGRTVNKELDAGRYLRWKRMGIAGCAIDLPGHGERSGDPAMQEPGSTLLLAEQAAREIDLVLEDLASERFNGAFDLSRVAIGGMSAGGMVTLLRVCSLGLENRFKAVVLEATTGDFASMHWPRVSAERVEALSPVNHVADMPTVPMLAVHSKADEVVPFGPMAAFIEKVREEYARRGVDPELARMHAWDETGAPSEHMGFGRVTNETKNLENGFLGEWLGVP